ncbi:MAG TPA: hypothetical protein VI298_16930 [Geobacteraceae bacterium]
MNVPQMLTENLGLKALSLFLAVVLWLFVTLGMDGETGVTVPVRFQNLSPRLAIVNRTPIFLDLRIAGPKILLMQLDKQSLAATLDLGGVGEGTVMFANLERAVPLRSGLRITRVYPSALELKLAGKAEGKRSGME